MLVCGEELFDPIHENRPHHLSLGIEQEQFNRRISAPQSEIRILLSPAENITTVRYLELINAEEILNRGLSASRKLIRDRITYFDSLLTRDIRCTGLAGTCSDQKGRPFKPAELLSTACNHILLEEPFTGDFIHDKMNVFKALRAGRVFIALDGLSDAKGFRFSAEGDNQDAVAWSGDTIFLKNSITLKISIPEACECRLIRNGKIIKVWQQCRQVPYTIYEPGCYRVECALTRRKELYDWIFSNPIYAVKG